MKRWMRWGIAIAALIVAGALALVILNLVQLERELARCERLGIPAPECR
jgi:hypothetical protein